MILTLLSRRSLCLAASLLAAFALPLRAQTAASVTATPSLIENSNMETDANADGWPDGWPGLKTGGSWENEEGNHFIRMTSTTPGAMVMLYREINIPEGVKALELTWRQRVTGLKRGKQSWFDARIMMEFMDANRGKIGPSPKPAATGRDTGGWVEKSESFLVPDGARILKFMPALFNVEAGTFDLDDMVLKPADAAPLIAAAAEAKKLADQAAARQSKAAASLAAGSSLISNGDFETPGKSDDSAAGWGAGTRETDPDGNHFYRLVNTEPGKTVLSYRSIVLPAGVKAFQLSLRWRVTNLKPGAMPWFDARIMMDVLDASGNKLKPQPSPVYTRGNTKDGAWVERTTSFLVPDGGVTLELMPSLFNVKSGTLDLDDIVLAPTDPEAILARQQAREEAAAKSRVPVEQDIKANWPPELRTQGNRLVTVAGGKEVWLQGVSIPSLEWSVGGEQVQKSTVVAIDRWKANAIRLPVNDDYWFGRNQADGGKAYRDLVDQIVTLAANRGAYVVLDLHRYRAPKPAYIDFWKDAATRYKNHPAVLFDLMNEPHGTTWPVWRDGGFIGEKKELDQAAFLSADDKKKLSGYESPGMQAMLDAVRATGAKNLVVVGGLDYAYQLDGILDGFALKDTPEGDGIMYACHIYPWKKGWQKYLLDAAAKYPILLGEVGADANKMSFIPAAQQEDAATWVPAILGLIQQHRLNWTGWSFHPKASPRMLLDWDYTPTPFWGEPAKEALAGKQFPPPDHLR